MTIKNKLFNYFHKVRRIRTKGSVNAGTYFDKNMNTWIMCKYDWGKPFSFITKKMMIGNERSGYRSLHKL